jgi:hypothetical protein
MQYHKVIRNLSQASEGYVMAAAYDTAVLSLNDVINAYFTTILHIWI